MTRMIYRERMILSLGVKNNRNKHGKILSDKN